MGNEVICTWLGLSSAEWPPDHYRLLGLQPGESDPQLIEQHVHQRLDSVRCYQMRHPEQATEAMNRLAQAFVCLTEPAAKERYDAGLRGVSLPRSTKTPTMHDMPVLDPEAFAPPVVNGRKSSPNLVLPPPLPDVPPVFEPPLAIEMPPVREAGSTPLPEKILPPRPAPPPPAPPAEKVCPILEVARSARARRGLGSRRALFRRIRQTREFFETWMRAGKYLGTMKRRTTIKGSEAEELAELFADILRLRKRFPRILGEAGQPGCLVLSLARQDAVETFRTLEASQRGALRRDWQAGHDLLLAHRDFLREQAAELRRMTRKQRFGRAVRSFFTDDPGALFLLLALAALNGFLWWSWFGRGR